MPNMESGPVKARQRTCGGCLRILQGGAGFAAGLNSYRRQRIITLLAQLAK